MKTKYTVKAKRWEHGWELHIPGVGVTQSHSLVDADPMVRDYLALDTGADPSIFEITIKPVIDNIVEVEAAQARKAADDLIKAQETVGVALRNAAAHLLAAGLTQRDAAVVMGVSKQRMSQLVNH